ncbi:alpha/beta fold hydrolase [Labrys wisconsinensis]|uniref:Pimeloyl-ACP methyl ester carboxylesterase n=1 Tax=Labrys wisconsinensis TaxID=425677 RepID=A0ABU0JA99_9HYPH|nr:hypothetical protein [Labrys wisconsinensis]MDQ0471187.1 pimeloyl-ACP methyl ester carboxylesterase [Labrys wisconsinensis]
MVDKGAQVTLARHIRDLTPIHDPGVGHAPHREIPERVARDIETFLLSPEEPRLSARKELRHVAG